MALSQRINQANQEAAMTGKARSGPKDDKQTMRQKKEPNLGQKEAGQQQQSDSKLNQMGSDQSTKSDKQKRQQG